ncbi:uracil-DNA glycosylase family protein [Roseateles sp.]|uniref:uracil-DNA glycosylase family protein n=1 Tax=Roseateles sp. TaxID=1971397 RepID=UPI0039ECE028
MADGPLARLLPELRACTRCEPALPLGARPIFQLGATARVLIAGQAPGRIAHEKGRPFDDASGDRLRQWLGVTREQFYDPARFAILPMGLCYPGTGPGGDLPPRPECAPLWRRRVLDALPGIRLTLAIGQYALAWHLGRKASVAEQVAGWRDGLARGRGAAGIAGGGGGSRGGRTQRGLTHRRQARAERRASDFRVMGGGKACIWQGGLKSEVQSRQQPSHGRLMSRLVMKPPYRAQSIAILLLPPHAVCIFKRLPSSMPRNRSRLKPNEGPKFFE